MKMDFNWESVNGLARALGGRVELLEKVFKEKGLTPAMIQKIVASGFASDFFDIGDEIMTTYTATDGTVYDFPWLVVDFRDVYWENDPESHPGMVLQAKYATAEGVPYDAPENTEVDSEIESTAQEGWYYFGKNGNVYTALNLNVGDELPFDSYTSIHKCIYNERDIVANGYSNYELSAVRQWLNSDNSAGEWWTPSHLGDVAPDQASTLNGFMAGLSADFIEVLIPTKIKYLFKNNAVVMYDKMFLPSYEEMYGVNSNDANGIEGPYFQYWKEKTGLSFPNNSNNNGRIVTTVNGIITIPGCWTRTSGDYITVQQLHVMNSGSFFGGANVLKTLFYTLPCCVIS